jgi:hypothetical protein
MYQSIWWLTFGTIFIPTAFVYYLDSHEKVLSSIMFFIGMGAIFYGNYLINKERKENFDTLKAQFENQKIIENNTNLRHKELIEELRKLRGDKNDKPDKSDSTM